MRTHIGSVARKRGDLGSAFLMGLLLLTPNGYGQHAQTAKDAPAGQDAVPQLTYDLASIRPTDPNLSVRTSRYYDPAHEARLNAENLQLANLITLAYGMRWDRIEGVPNWVEHAEYTIKAESDASVTERLQQLDDKQALLAKQAMLRTLLVQRFNLQAHLITRDLPVFTVTQVKGGAKITTASAAEKPDIQDRCAERVCDFKVVNQPISQLIQTLFFTVGGDVVDQTGLTGKYDFELKWLTPGEDETTESPAPPVALALTQQLGLKLTASKAPGKVLVLDHIEQPSTN